MANLFQMIKQIYKPKKEEVLEYLEEEQNDLWYALMQEIQDGVFWFEIWLWEREMSYWWFRKKNKGEVE